MDRFALRLSLGYVSAETEVEIVAAQEQRHPLDAIAPCVAAVDVHRLRRAVREIRIGMELKRYAVELARATRAAASVQLGAGPRASLALSRMSQALALVRGEDFVTPDHVRDMAVPVLAHRLVLDPQAKFSGVTAQRVVEDVLRAVPVPS
jgi:MoxR-like ATPase